MEVVYSRQFIVGSLQSVVYSRQFIVGSLQSVVLSYKLTSRQVDKLTSLQQQLILGSWFMVLLLTQNSLLLTQNSKLLSWLLAHGSWFFSLLRTQNSCTGSWYKELVRGWQLVTGLKHSIPDILYKKSNETTFDQP